MDLSIIILNYKTGGLVRQCLRGVIEAELKLDYEILLVDNHSQDDSLSWVQDNYPTVRTISLPVNRGYSAGNNEGIRRAKGKYLLILNPDVTIFAGSLERLVAFMENNPTVGLAGPRLNNPDGSLQYSAYSFPNFWLPLIRRTWLRHLGWFKPLLRKYQLMDWSHQDNQPVDWLLGACLIARAAAVEQVGLLDERFFLYVEDTDWCRRFWQKGWQVYYAADVELVHFHERLSAQANFGALFKKITWIHIASWFKYFFKWRMRYQDKLDRF
ncbi:glycosyltransferase family 2 protein [Patescibacteria group bacterium]|nr:glycosyltransferase family 2 protein [Patescibacteria group bacterium]